MQYRNILHLCMHKAKKLPIQKGKKSQKYNPCLRSKIANINRGILRILLRGVIIGYFLAFFYKK